MTVSSYESSLGCKSVSSTVGGRELNRIGAALVSSSAYDLQGRSQTNISIEFKIFWLWLYLLLTEEPCGDKGTSAIKFIS